MAATHVYHWKHGWIPLDHTAALTKAKGDRHAAAQMLHDAHTGQTGIRSKRDVAAAIRDLPSVSAGHRAGPRHEIIAAARRHDAEGLLPASMSHQAQTLPTDLVRDLRGGSAERHLVIDESGTRFSAERAALHDRIVQHVLGDHQPQEHPAFVMLGGGPASGKTKASQQAEHDFPDAVKIDPDELKKLLPEYKQMTPDQAAAFVHEESSYLAKKVTEEALKRRANVVLDAVGDNSVENVRNKIRNAREAGYSVHARYVTVPTEIAQGRAHARGIKSGRVVQPKVVEKLHQGVSTVFPQVLHDFDTAALYDNTSEWKLVLQAYKGQPEILHELELWRAFLRKANGR